MTPADLLTHYTALAKTPGWRAYVWDRVKEMARECPELYRELPQLLAEKMKE